jgi:hypothetical protein
MNSLRQVILLLCLAASLFFLSGCKATLLVHDAAVEGIVPILKDYAGTHGYQISYANEQTGSFRLDLGSVYISEVSNTTKSKYTITSPPSKDGNQPTTSYEDTTWHTVSTPGHYVKMTAIVSIVQQGKDVVISIDSNDLAGSALGDFRDYLVGFGYKVDNR